MRKIPHSPGDSIQMWLLAQDEQQPSEVAALLADFISQAQHSLDIAIYDFRLSPPLAGIVAAALRASAAQGVRIRIAYDADKPATPRLITGMDPAPGGTGAFVQALGYPWRRIASQKLMHHKYILRDVGAPDAAIWTGSTNFTDDAWSLQENTIIQFASSDLAALYARDFEQLWISGTIESSGDFDGPGVQLSYAGNRIPAQAFFSPGRGPTIDYDIAAIVARARRRVRLCSMLLNSSALIAALGDLLHAGLVPVDGIFDRTQMDEVLRQWQDVPHNHWKIPAVRDIVRAAQLVGKDSTPYAPDSPHDFMHNKSLIVDDTLITGSYNFSRSAEMNAENLLIINSPDLADAYSAYIDHLQAKYGR